MQVYPSIYITLHVYIVHVYIILYTVHYSPTKILKGDKASEGVSSDDFAKFMMSLQGSTNMVEDPGKSLSAATHTSRTGM